MPQIIHVAQVTSVLDCTSFTRAIDRRLFEKYRRRYSPYGSVASLYLWAVAGGAIPGMKDCAPKKPAKPQKTNERKGRSGVLEDRPAGREKDYGNGLPL